MTANTNMNFICKDYSRIYSNIRIFATLSLRRWLLNWYPVIQRQRKKGCGGRGGRLLGHTADRGRQNKWQEEKSTRESTLFSQWSFMVTKNCL